MVGCLGTEGNIHFESNGLFAVVVGRRHRLRIPGLRDLMGYRAMWEHLVERLRHGGASPISLEAARSDLAFVDAAYRSLESARFEPLLR